MTDNIEIEPASSNWLNFPPPHIELFAGNGRQQVIEAREDAIDRNVNALIAEMDARDRAAAVEQIASPLAPRPTLVATTYAAWAKQPRFKRRPVFGWLAYLGEVTLLSAPGGLAKSTLASAMAMSLATGRDLLGFAPKQCRVLYINLEDAVGEVCLRLEAVARHHGFSFSDVDGWLHAVGADQGGLLTFTHQFLGRDAIRPEAIAALRQCVARCGADVVILDPLVAAIGGGQNDQNLMGQLLRELKKLATAQDFALILVAHTRKGSNALTDGADATAGSGALTNLSRVGLGLVGVSEARARELGILPGEERRYRELVNTKANLAPIQDGFIVELVSVGMGNGTADYPDEDKVAVAIPYTPPAGGGSWVTSQMQRDVLVRIAKGSAGVSLSPASRGSRSFVDPCSTALAPHLPGKNRCAIESAAKHVVGDLVARNWVEAVDAAVPKASGGTNKSKGFTVHWDRTPWANDPRPGPFVA